MPKAKARLKGGKKAIDLIKKIKASVTKGPSKLRVGLPEDSADYPDGTPVVMVGTVHEFGSIDGKVPERSWLRSTIVKNAAAYKAIQRAQGKAILMGKLTFDKAVNALGLRAASDVKGMIIDISTPALKHREGNPLVDTGHLVEAVTYEVSE